MIHKSMKSLRNWVMATDAIKVRAFHQLPHPKTLSSETSTRWRSPAAAKHRGMDTLDFVSFVKIGFLMLMLINFYFTRYYLKEF